MSAKEQKQDTLPVSLAKALPKAVDAAKTLRQLNTQLMDTHKQFEKALRGGAISAARAFVVLRKLKDRMEETEKLFKMIFERAAKEMLPNVFEQEGVTNVPLSEGFRVTTSSTLYANILKENRDAAIKWLKDNGLGDIVAEALDVSSMDDKKRKLLEKWLKRNGVENFVVRSVNVSTLSAVARTMLEQEARELPEPIFKTEFVRNTSVTAVKGKSATVQNLPRI